MSPLEFALSLGTTLAPLVELLIPVIVIASSRPRREPFTRRAAVATGIAAAMELVTTSLVYIAIHASAEPIAGVRLFSLVSSVVLLVCLVPYVMYLYETSVWQALFCAGAGYTIQNLASGTSELLTYLLNHCLGIHVGLSMITGLSVDSVPLAIAVIVLPFAMVCALSYLVFVRPLRREDLGDVEDCGMAVVLVLVILVVISFDVLIKSLDDIVSIPAMLALRGVHGVVCCFVLFVQFEILRRRSVERELAESQQIAAERERQYQLSRANIDAINVKCHDIKHQIRQAAAGDQSIDPEFVAGVEREIAVYDSQAKTGNEALDTILTEKGLLCEREGISLSVIADGKALGALGPSEVYSLFGNALDNAIEAVRALPDPGQRSISLTVRRVGELASMHLENYFEGERSFSQGMPQTSKADASRHGFGTRSMRGIVERHGGTITFGQRGHTFTVDAIIPMPLEQKG